VGEDTADSRGPGAELIALPATNDYGAIGNERRLRGSPKELPPSHQPQRAWRAWKGVHLSSSCFSFQDAGTPRKLETWTRASRRRGDFVGSLQWFWQAQGRVQVLCCKASKPQNPCPLTRGFSGGAPRRERQRCSTRAGRRIILATPSTYWLTGHRGPIDPHFTKTPTSQSTATRYDEVRSG